MYTKENFIDLPFLFTLTDIINDVEFNYDSTTQKIKSSLIEYDDKYQVKLVLPGYDKNKLEIESLKGNLVVKYNDKSENEKDESIVKKLGYNIKPTNFNREFSIPDDFNIEKSTAEYIDGILTVTVPKDYEKIKSRKIKIS